MPKSALIRVRELREVFGHVSASNFEAIVARLAVLYEDMRIELFGISEKSISSLDTLGVNYRRIYFLRKSISTLLEFVDAIGQLQRCPEFGTVSAEFTPEVRKNWEKSAAFFNRNEDRLRLVRNDTGGHFGLDAARYASQNLPSGSVDRIERVEPFSKSGRVLLHFSGELVATAMLRHVWGLDRDHKSRHLVRLALVGYRHATRCVLYVVICYLWDKFGK